MCDAEQDPFPRSAPEPRLKRLHGGIGTTVLNRVGPWLIEVLVQPHPLAIAAYGD